MMLGNEMGKAVVQIGITVCPLLALIFSIFVTIVTLYINQGISPPFIFISIQVYLNWYSIYTISQNAIIMKQIFRQSKCSNVVVEIKSESDSSPKFKFWYCEKCSCHTYQPTQHCGACRRCFHFRDHHCFFLGACIIQQNMGNFILICFYTSLACLYSLSIIGPYLYNNLQQNLGQDSSVSNIILNFCFPIAFARLLIFGETDNLHLIILFDILFSVLIMCSFYGFWKLFTCLTGRQKYYPHIARKQTIQELFGNHGIYNFLFPYDGFCSMKNSKKINELKEI